MIKINIAPLITSCRYVFLIGFILYTLTAPATAQSTLSTSVDPRSGSIQDSFIFTVTYEGDSTKIIPQLSAGGDFTISYVGPKTMITVANGVVKSSQSHVYQLHPKQTGTLQTPEVQVEVNGTVLSAPPIAISVSESSTLPESNTPNADIFLQHTGTPQSVVVGQQIVNNLALYTRKNIKGITIDDEPAEGFWQETISNGENHQRTLNGKHYSTVEISRALFPLRAGELTIPGRVANLKVVEPRSRSSGRFFDPFSDSFFQDFFDGGRITERTLKADPVRVIVTSLPEIPESHRLHTPTVPIVGSTTLRVEYSGLPLKVGEAREVTITVTSTGNLNPLKSLDLQADTSYKTYPRNVEQRQKLRAGMLEMERVFHFSIVPLRAGIVGIPSAKLSYFDPAAQSFKLAATDDIALVVTKGDSSGAASFQSNPLSPNERRSSTTLIPTLPPISSSPDLRYSAPSSLENLREIVSKELLLGCMFVILVVIISLLTTRNHRRRRKKLKELELAIKQAPSVNEVDSLIVSWLISSLNIETNCPSYDDLRAYVRSKIKKPERSAEIILFIDELESARYSSSKEDLLPLISSRALRIIDGN